MKSFHGNKALGEKRNGFCHYLTGFVFNKYTFHDFIMRELGVNNEVFPRVPGRVGSK